MMLPVKSVQPIVWFTLCVAMTCGCKLGGSHVKDQSSADLAKSIGGGLVAVSVPNDQIQRHIAPADGSNGIPATMNGIWWTNANTVHFIVSLHNAAWDPATHTASIPFQGNETYSVPTWGQKVAQVDPFAWTMIDRTFNGYDIVFNEEGDFAQLFNAVTDLKTGNRVHEATTPFTMQYVSDGVWVRRSVGQPDYFLRRIVNADGTQHKTPVPSITIDGVEHKQISAWDAYLADPSMSPNILVTKPALVLSAEHPTAQLSLDPLAPATYVEVVGGNRVYGTVRVTSADLPVRLYVRPQSGPVIGIDQAITSFTGDLGPKVALAIQPASQQANGIVKVEYQPLPHYEIKDDGVPATVTLNPGDPDASVLATPSGQVQSFYALTTDAPFPLTLSALDTDGHNSNTPTVISGPSNQTMIVRINGRGSINLKVQNSASNVQGGTFHVKMTPYQPLADRRIGPAPCDGSQISGTLTGVNGVDLYTVPASTKVGSGSVSIAPPVGGPDSTFYVKPLQSYVGLAEQVYFQTFEYASRDFYLPPGQQDIAVFYAGDLNTANPPLKYAFSLCADGNGKVLSE